MNERLGSDGKNAGGRYNDDVGRLIRHVGAREAVPVERLERARRHVHSHWEQVVAAQGSRRRADRFRLLSIAAGIVVVAGASYALWNLTGPAQPAMVASVDRVLGDVRLQREPAAAGVVVGRETRIETADDGRVALRMAGGQSLRIDTSSRVIVRSENHVALQSGALYIDTALAANAAPILVSTPLGSARDVGTQFQVRLTASSLVIGVRDGIVEVAQPGQENVPVHEGYSFSFDARGQSRENPLQDDDPGWHWIETVVPEFTIQDATLEEYLLWFARERNLTLVWADAGSERHARRARLSGTIAGTTLEESLGVVKRIAPFEHRIEGETLWVRVD